MEPGLPTTEDGKEVSVAVVMLPAMLTMDGVSQGSSGKVVAPKVAEEDIFGRAGTVRLSGSFPYSIFSCRRHFARLF